MCDYYKQSEWSGHILSFVLTQYQQLGKSQTKKPHVAKILTKKRAYYYRL